MHTYTHSYTRHVTQVHTEDDILHVANLPDFGGTLGQRDSELLLSYLTVPYLRVPLIINFFASDNRVQALKSRALRSLLEHALVEPGRCAFLPVEHHDLALGP